MSFFSFFSLYLKADYVCAQLAELTHMFHDLLWLSTVYMTFQASTCQKLDCELLGSSSFLFSTHETVSSFFHLWFKQFPFSTVKFPIVAALGFFLPLYHAGSNCLLCRGDHLLLVSWNMTCFFPLVLIKSHTMSNGKYHIRGNECS